MSLDSVSIINLALDRIGQQPIANMGQTPETALGHAPV